MVLLEFCMVSNVVGFGAGCCCCCCCCRRRRRPRRVENDVPIGRFPRLALLIFAATRTRLEPTRSIFRGLPAIVERGRARARRRQAALSSQQREPAASGACSVMVLCVSRLNLCRSLLRLDQPRLTLPRRSQPRRSNASSRAMFLFVSLNPSAPSVFAALSALGLSSYPGARLLRRFVFLFRIHPEHERGVLFAAHLVRLVRGRPGHGGDVEHRHNVHHLGRRGKCGSGP